MIDAILDALSLLHAALGVILSLLVLLLPI